ncbi:MAG: Rrf2 family transcriptional regulator [Paracoccaceae bacterium]|jgi:Rrf2 family nitric oxide-sensitive transcriptional repressor|nr:Rrf2 family transcriptional regulator [Paracoccaceae bacterium]MDP7186615.1 Rrf2 family transcriptional regulator [Paracoccaceae bacterium]
MRVTKRSNLALRVLMFCGVNSGRLVTKHDIAEKCNSSENHLGQVVNQLAQRGVVDTVRGRGGGIRLGRPASDIKIGQIFRMLEADSPVAECFADVDNTCPLTSACRLKAAISMAVDAFYAKLDELTLHDLIEDNRSLEQILCLDLDLSCAAETRQVAYSAG